MVRMLTSIFSQPRTGGNVLNKEKVFCATYLHTRQISRINEPYDVLAPTFQLTGYLLQTMNLDEVSPATRLLEKRRQMFEVQEALETQKEEFARREELFKRREEALRKQDLELQQQLIRFNKFLQVWQFFGNSVGNFFAFRSHPSQNLL